MSLADAASKPRVGATDLFDPVELGPYTPAQPHRHGAADALARRRGRRSRASCRRPITPSAQRPGSSSRKRPTSAPRARATSGRPASGRQEQVAGWRLTTKAVHDKGGRIFLQLWHVGRISHPDLQPGGALPVAPTAIRAEGQKAYTYDGFKAHVTPRALETEEIPGIVADYAHAAQCAKDAGFDGVEIHSANGYLLQQFLSDKTNKRTDRYGGSIENRTRFVVEVVDAVTRVWGGDRVGIRLSPLTKFGDIGDSNPEPRLSVADRADQSVRPRLHPRHRGRHGRRAQSARRLRSAEAAPRLQRALHRQQQLRPRARPRGARQEPRRPHLLRAPLHRQPGSRRAPAHGRAARRA